ncbi:MAG: fused response regulator/phosphatase [Syntrophobacter sp.]
MNENEKIRPGVRNSVILIIDDDPTTVRMLVGILGQVGFQTASAASGGQGIALALSLRPDLILLDVHLPDIDGFNVCRQVHRSLPTADTPILFISANEDVSLKVEGFEAGGIDYITKPLSGVEVIARVRTHLRLKHAYETLAQLQAEKIKRLATSQQMILPMPDSLPEARFAVSLRQIHGAGGDFYDVIPIGKSLVDYVAADASGHDLETSLWTTAMKTLLHEHASPLYDPSDVLRAINRSLCRVMPEGQFFTAVYARMNRQTGRLTIVNCGHPPAICLQRNKGPEVVHQTGDVIGAFKDAIFETTDVSLNPGDRFFLYTDGLIESGSNRETGIMNLVSMCEDYRGLPLDAMVNAMTARTLAGTDLEDDIVLMGVEV